MKDDPIDVRQAIADVALLRRVLNQVQKHDTGQSSPSLFGTTVNANILLQGGTLLLALALTCVELFSEDFIFTSLVLNGVSPDFRLAGIGIIVLILIAIGTGLYFVLWRTAQHSGEEFGAYIKRNFRYARHVSYLSDILMKFFALALLLLADQSQWVAPLLLAFTGDYLLQGRLFTFSTKLAVTLGVICIAGGIIQFFLESSSLLVPLAVFSAIIMLSMGKLMKLQHT